MQRSLLGLMFLGGLTVWLAGTGTLTAQSARKKGGTTCDLDGLKSQVYDFWKDQKKEGNYIYKFLLPKDLKANSETAELVVYPVTSKPEDVIANWKKHFDPPKNGRWEDISRQDTFKVGAVNVSRLTIRGTYFPTDKPDDPIDKAKKVDNTRLQGYVFEGKNTYVIQVVGQSKVADLHLNDIEAWVKAFK